MHSQENGSAVKKNNAKNEYYYDLNDRFIDDADLKQMDFESSNEEVFS